MLPNHIVFVGQSQAEVPVVDEIGEFHPTIGYYRTVDAFNALQESKAPIVICNSIHYNHQELDFPARAYNSRHGLNQEIIHTIRGFDGYKETPIIAGYLGITKWNDDIKKAYVTAGASKFWDITDFEDEGCLATLVRSCLKEQA